ncbi:flap endonuclease GEN isoform X2 [Anabrus simplex]
MMGLSSIQSMGEAEALCALLDQNRVVDGCISQDSDCLLYGAQTVYRNFTISPTNGNAGFSIDMYKMSAIQEKLSLSRDKLIAMSLLCGCDYNEKGVAGVGKETVLKFLNGVAEGEVLDRLRKWRNNTHLDMLEEAKAAVAKGLACERCGHKGRQQRHEKSGCVECGVSTGCLQDPLRIALTDPVTLAELAIRKKALLDENFPCEATIQEFLQKENVIPFGKLEKTWKRPDLLTFIKYSTKKLSWTEMYALGKFLPLVTRWQLQHIISNKGSASTSFLLSPQSIIKKRVKKGILSYEVQWTDEHGCLRNIDLDEGVTLESLLVTVEPQTLLQEAYPRLVSNYLEKIAAKNKKGKAKKKRGKAKCEGKENSSCGVQTKLDGFVVRQQPSNNIEDLFNKISLDCKENKNSSQSITVKNVKTMQPKLPTSFGTLKPCNGNIASSSPSASDGLAACKPGTLQKPAVCLQSVTHTAEFDLSDEYDSCEECDVDCSLDLSSIIQDIVGKENYHSGGSSQSAPMESQYQFSSQCCKFDLLGHSEDVLSLLENNSHYKL